MSSIGESEPGVQPLPDSVLIRLMSDMTEDGRFGERVLLVDSSEVRVETPEGVAVLRVPLSEVRRARHEPLASGGRMLIETSGGVRLTAVSYSLAVSEAFSEAARGIEQLAEGQELSINLEKGALRCEKCGKLLPEVDGPCPSCVDRKRTMLRVMQFLKPYKKQTAFLVACAVGSTVCNLMPPMIMRHLTDGFTSKNLAVPELLQWMAFWLGVALIASFLQVMNGRTMAFLATHISADLRAATYRAIEYLSLRYFDKKPVGAIASRVTQDTDRLWQFLVDGLPFFIINGLMAVGVMGFLFSLEWTLALAILSPIPFVIAISMKFWRPISNMFFRVSQRMARLHMQLNESLSGIRVVKAFVREDHEYDRFQNRNHAWKIAAMQADQKWYTAFGMMTFCAASGTLINWGLGGWYVLQDRLSLGEFIQINALLVMVYGPMQWFAQVNNWFSRAMAGAERVFEVLDTTPEVDPRSTIEHPIRGEVEFDDVRFGYDKSNPVIKGMSFTAKPGEMIGLVGRSGAGKSSTINLICRFYEPDQGVIRVDGIDVRDITLNSYRSQIGIVLQEPFLFDGTIGENIAYGKPNASMDEIMTAARAANAHDFIVGKPDGYDTIVGERGTHLSGGEKQRISIARAILHNPRILILDEATSSVDVETERQIQEAIGRLVEGRTTFAIAHRLSTLRNADRLIVLDRGEIAEIGTHEELMARQSVFYSLVQAQNEANSIIGIGT